MISYSGRNKKSPAAAVFFEDVRLTAMTSGLKIYVLSYKTSIHLLQLFWGVFV